MVSTFKDVNVALKCTRTTPHSLRWESREVRHPSFIPVPPADWLPTDAAVVHELANHMGTRLAHGCPLAAHLSTSNAATTGAFSPDGESLKRRNH